MLHKPLTIYKRSEKVPFISWGIYFKVSSMWPMLKGSKPDPLKCSFGVVLHPWSYIHNECSIFNHIDLTYKHVLSHAILF